MARWHRTFRAVSRTALIHVAWILGIVALLLVAWFVVLRTGGTRQAWPHLFYLPIVVAALPFGVAGSIATAIVATVLCGPLTPLDTSTGAEQTTMNWLTRGGFFVVVGTVTGLIVAARARAAAMATVDRLSGVANRARLDDELARQLARIQRSGDACSVAMFDLDDFKAINATYGHRAGDQVITEAAQRLSTACRAADLVGRWGGEEFVVIAPDTPIDDAVTLAERCRRALAASPIPPLTRAVTASVGVAEARADDDVRSLVHRADAAMYRAKQRGRDRVVAAPADLRPGD
ncbi:MAG: diguanylate cyclase [Nitriliruptoraceae bacterium]